MLNKKLTLLGLIVIGPNNLFCPGTAVSCLRTENQASPFTKKLSDLTPFQCKELREALQDLFLLTQAAHSQPHEIEPTEPADGSSPKDRIYQSQIYAAMTRILEIQDNFKLNNKAVAQVMVQFLNGILRDQSNLESFLRMSISQLDRTRYTSKIEDIAKQLAEIIHAVEALNITDPDETTATFQIKISGLMATLRKTLAHSGEAHNILTHYVKAGLPVTEEFARLKNIDNILELLATFLDLLSQLKL